MKKIVLTFTILLAANLAHARDDVIKLPFKDVVEMGLASGKLDGSVQFFLSGAPTSNVSATLGEGVSNKKTNSANKADDAACRWAALSALISFQNSAKQKGANAVIDMHSFYNQHPFKDVANFECHAGSIMAGVALKGTYAKLP